MSAKNIYQALTLLLGYGLIIAGVLIFGDELPRNIQILDIVVLCVVFSQFAIFTFFPLVNLSNRAHREVGMLGIHLAFLNFCCLASLGIMVAGIYFQWAFKYQATGQAAVLFLLLLGRMLSFMAGDNVERVHVREQAMTGRRNSLRETFASLEDKLSLSDEAAPDTRQRLFELCDTAKYVSPSSDAQCIRLDEEIGRQVSAVEMFLRAPRNNDEALKDTIALLETLLRRRKQL